MNDWDRDNLNFILNADEAEFEAWMAQSDRSDIDYALELLAQHRTELQVAEMNAKDSELEMDCTQAQAVIARIRQL